MRQMCGIRLGAGRTGHVRDVGKAAGCVTAEFGKAAEAGRTSVQAAMHNGGGVRCAKVVHVCGRVSTMDAAGDEARCAARRVLGGSGASGAVGTNGDFPIVEARARTE